jgi:hypothetical protein
MSIAKGKARAAQRAALKEGATISQIIRQRLYGEATNSAAFEGMTSDEIKGEVDQRLTVYLDQMPFWFGRTQVADVRSRENQRRYKIDRGLLPKGQQPEALRRHQAEKQAFFDERERNASALETVNV